MTPIYHDNVSQFQHIAPGRAQRGGGVPKTKKTAPTSARAKHAQVAAPDFSAPRGDWGQLGLPKLIEKGTAKAPQSQSKNDTTDNDKTQTGNKSAVGLTFVLTHVIRVNRFREARGHQFETQFVCKNRGFMHGDPYLP